MSGVANTYHSRIRKEMEWLGKKKDTIFLGLGIATGDRMYHTMDDVPVDKCIEMPIAENLIMGTAIGLAMQGYVPVVVFQRMDFMLIAADQIINHLALMSSMSGGQYNPKVIIRACIGSQCKKFDVGAQHNHDFTHVFEPYIATIGYGEASYIHAYESIYSCILVEEKDKYNDAV